MNAPKLSAKFDVGQSPSKSTTFGILSTYTPTACGLATFSKALAEGLSVHGASVGVVRISDGLPTSDVRLVGELRNGSARSVAATSELLNHSDIAIIQHEYGIYGGADGDEVVEIISGLDVPCIVVAHTVLTNPSPHQRSVLEAVAALRSCLDEVEPRFAAGAP